MIYIVTISMVTMQVGSQFPNIINKVKKHVWTLCFVRNVYFDIVESLSYTKQLISVVGNLTVMCTVLLSSKIYFDIVESLTYTKKFISVVGNLTVMCTVLLRKEMRTARNIFIFNLALSDFLLATSIPFTVMDAMSRAWPLPESLLACRYGFYLK